MFWYQDNAAYANRIRRIPVKIGFRRNLVDLLHVLLDSFRFTTKLFQKITVNLCLFVCLFLY